MPRFSALGDFIALDFETTGLLPEHDTIIEIGAVRFSDGVEVERFATLINPRRSISPEISQLTGITNDALKAAPTLADVRDDFAIFIEDTPIMAHNTEFERKFLKHLYGASYEPVSMLDTKDILALMYPLAPSLSLEYYIKRFGLRDYEHHRGLEDALDMVAVLKCLDVELDNSEFESLCAIVEYWFQHSSVEGASGWGWKPFFAERHGGSLPDYRNFKEMYAKLHRAALDESLAQAPAQLKDAHLFQRVYDRYQLRTAQQQMAAKAAQILNDGGLYVVEAGTGTGKTLAYLSAALATLATDASSPVVISTHTKALQNQFLDQELPRLQKLFHLSELHAVVLKGMSNYACLRKLSAALPEEDRLFPDDVRKLYAGAFIMRWIDATREGELEEFPRPLYEFPTIQSVANEANADFRDCTRQECTFYKQCFYFKKQWESQSAHILAVNHSLLLSYPKSYPEFDRLIVDEADELSAEAVEAFSNVASRTYINDTLKAVGDQYGVISDVYRNAQIIARDVNRKETNSDAAMTAMPNLSTIWDVGSRAQEILKRLTDIMLHIRSDDVFTVQATLNDTRLTGDTRKRLVEELENMLVVTAELQGFCEKVFRVAAQLEGTEPSTQTRELTHRLEDLQVIHQTIATFLEQDDKKAALYIRIEKQDWSLVVAPYNIGEVFAETVARKLSAAVFTSATISSTRDMQDFIKGLGLHLLEQGDNAKPIHTSRFKSPFNYRDNSRIIFLKGFPANNQPQFAGRSAEFIAQAASRLGGRTLVLFTSKMRLQQVHTTLFPLLQQKNIELISHGITNASQIKCVEQFKASDGAVLMGARGLWKGVDIPGDDLQCLVLEKMPYAVPNPFTKGLQDALVAHYADEARKRRETPDEKRLAGIAWNEVDKPLMFQAFRQMFGRLIRTEEDKGIMFVLDAQLQSGALSPRHKQLLELLPDVPYGLCMPEQALEQMNFL
jgi:predicted DnaQ family exonuclease/DinG family helicase